MIKESPPQMERNIARSRLILSVVALVSVYIDPTGPTLSLLPYLPRSWFSIDPYALAVFILHLVYSLTVYAAIARWGVDGARLAPLTTWADVGLSGLIAMFTEGASSPFYAFFVFCVVEVGLRSGFRQTLRVTGVSVALYLSTFLVSAPQELNFLIMRPVYLAITGYLVGYLGQQRLNLEHEIEVLAAAEQRNLIARELHDGYAQSLAGVSLRIERCRELIRRGRGAEVADDLTELQGTVYSEFDSLRAYSRALAGLDSDRAAELPANEPQCSLRADLRAPASVIEQVLLILREGTTNVWRHSQARSADFRVHGHDHQIVIQMRDDGVGFAAERGVPWSIRARVDGLGGQVEIDGAGSGGCVTVTLPDQRIV